MHSVPRTNFRGGGKSLGHFLYLLEFSRTVAPSTSCAVYTAKCTCLIVNPQPIGVVEANQCAKVILPSKHFDVKKICVANLTFTNDAVCEINCD